MDNVNLVVEGLKFMVLGMTTVYLFLLLMVFVLSIISKIVKKYFPTKKLSPIYTKREAPKISNLAQDNDAVVAAIVASIQEFKKQN